MVPKTALRSGLKQQDFAYATRFTSHPHIVNSVRVSSLKIQRIPFLRSYTEKTSVGVMTHLYFCILGHLYYWILLLPESVR